MMTMSRVLLPLLATHSSAFSAPRVCLIQSRRITRRHEEPSRKLLLTSRDQDEYPSLDREEELSQFDKDLIEAFGKEEHQDDAITNAAFAAFARELRNVDDWDDDSTDDFLISETEAFTLYTETINDLNANNQVDLDDMEFQVPDDEKKFVDDVIASATRTIQEMWGEEGIVNLVREYLQQVNNQPHRELEMEDEVEVEEESK